MKWPCIDNTVANQYHFVNGRAVSIHFSTFFLRFVRKRASVHNFQLETFWQSLKRIFAWLFRFCNIFRNSCSFYRGGIWNKLPYVLLKSHIGFLLQKTGNRVWVKSPPRVRIPPTAPEESLEIITISSVFLFISGMLLKIVRFSKSPKKFSLMFSLMSFFAAQGPRR